MYEGDEELLAPLGLYEPEYDIDTDPDQLMFHEKLKDIPPAMQSISSGESSLGLWNSRPTIVSSSSACSSLMNNSPIMEGVWRLKVVSRAAR